MHTDTKESIALRIADLQAFDDGVHDELPLNDAERKELVMLLALIEQQS